VLPRAAPPRLAWPCEQRNTRRLLDWTPRVDLDESLVRMVAWVAWDAGHR